MKTKPRAALAATVTAWTALSTPPLVAQQPAPTGATKIAYESCPMVLEDGGVRCDIRVWVDGFPTTQVIGGVQPKWSPDGNRIAFVDAGYDNYGEIAVVNEADTSFRIYLTSATQYPSRNWTPSWSPDGRKVAYVSDRTGAPELYLVNADGTGTTRLTNGIGFTGDYAWSPEGGAIALGRRNSDGRDVYRMNADGSNLVRLTSSGGFTGRLVWSPRGARLTFDCGTEVCAANVDGTGLTQLTSGSAFAGSFSPTEDRLAYTIGQLGTTNEVVVKQGNGQTIPLAPATPGHTPEWSPDGNRLIFQGTETLEYSGLCEIWLCVEMTGIYRVNADGSDVQLLVLGTNPEWFAPRPGQPVASFTAECNGVSCVFDADGSEDPDGSSLNYAWQFGDGTTGSGVAPSHTYATGDDYVVTLTITDQQGLISTTSRRVDANTPPIAAFTVACNGPTCTFDASATVDPDGTIDNYLYNWNFGDGQGAFGVVAVHTYSTGSFLVRLWVRDNGGAISQFTTTVQVVNLPPTAAFTAMCTGFICTFDATASTGTDDAIRLFDWTFGDGNREYGGPVITHRYAATGSFGVTLTVSDAAFQQATASRTIVVAPQMHIGDLDGSKSQASPQLWNANATITVHDSEHRPVAGAIVVGTWSSGSGNSCMTDAAGRCVISDFYLPKKTGTAVFAVQAIMHDGFVYQSSANHDADGDSDGTTIWIGR